MRVFESDKLLTVQEELGKFVSSNSNLNTKEVIDIGMASQEMATQGLQTGNNNSSGSWHHASVLGSDDFAHVIPRHSLMEEHHIGEINNSPSIVINPERSPSVPFFHKLPRRLLQELSKKNGIHDNSTNVVMANALQS